MRTPAVFINNVTFHAVFKSQTTQAVEWTGVSHIIQAASEGPRAACAAALLKKTRERLLNSLLMAFCLLGLFIVNGCQNQQSVNVSTAIEESQMTKESVLSHCVFFTLADHSDQACSQLVEECHTWLKDHPGEIFFFAGTRAKELDRPVNDQDFDVSLLVVFKNKQAHDDYQKSARHLEFINRNENKWTNVRVFDALTAGYTLEGSKCPRAKL